MGSLVDVSLVPYVVGGVKHGSQIAGHMLCNLLITEVLYRTLAPIRESNFSMSGNARATTRSAPTPLLRPNNSVGVVMAPVPPTYQVDRDILQMEETCGLDLTATLFLY